MIKVKIIKVDEFNETGMFHLNAEFSEDEVENNADFKTAHLNEIVEMKFHHFYGKTKVYFCDSLNEYFSENEIEELK